MRHIHPIQFDYNPQPGLGSYLLLLIGLGLMGLAAWWTYHSQMALHEVQSERAHAIRLAKAKQPAPKPARSPAAQVAMDKIKAQFAYPWQSVFQSLESVHLANVHLMRIEPEISTGKLKLFAVGDDHEAMYDYIRAMNGQYGITQVDLIGHQTLDKQSLKSSLTKSTPDYRSNQSTANTSAVGSHPLSFELAIQVAQGKG